MSSKNPTNLAESIRHRLRNQATQTGKERGDLLPYYVMERFLFRLSQSRHAEKFVLKGALMLHAFGGDLSRSTRDIDFWSSHENNLAAVIGTIKECLQSETIDDGVLFDEKSIDGYETQFESRFRGVHLTILAWIGHSKFKVEIDICFGDSLSPEPLWVIYPQLLDFGSPKLLGVRPEAIVADKFEAMVSRDTANSRMKDFYDIWVISENMAFDGETLKQAIFSTFQSYGTHIPIEKPICLRPEFFERPDKNKQWSSFLQRNIRSKEPSLLIAVTRIDEFLTPICDSLNTGNKFIQKWHPKGPWMSL